MRRIFSCALAAWIVTGLIAVAGRAADNVAPEGYELLFNGKDLTGWKGLVPTGGPQAGSPIARAKLTPEELAEAQKVADEEMKAHWKADKGSAGLRRQGKEPL